MRGPAVTSEGSSGRVGTVSPGPSGNSVVLCLWSPLEKRERSLHSISAQSGWVHCLHLYNSLPDASDVLG